MMHRQLSRRGALGRLLIGAAALGAMSYPVRAVAEDTLERLRQQKKVKVAVPDNPPYSGLNTDGTITGLAPTLVKTILGRLGVPEVEGIVVPYGQLIPGLQAGRWDIIAACLSFTKERCPQVSYADPIVSEGGILVYLPGALPNPPQSVADIAKLGLTMVAGQGSYVVQRAQTLGVSSSNIIQVPDIDAELNALLAKRAQVGYSTYYGTLTKLKEHPDQFKYTYPLPDDQPRGSSCAFRPADVTLYSAFQKELRAMKQSGEFKKLADQFNFPPAGQVLTGTAEEECTRQSQS